MVVSGCLIGKGLLLFCFGGMERNKFSMKNELKDSCGVDEEGKYYQVEKILDSIKQGGKTYYLVKWLNWDVKTCSWEEEASVMHLKALIKDYHASKKHDRQNNLGLKQFDWIQPGMSPYEATRIYGHLLYGDQPLAIASVQMAERDNRKEMYLEVEWESRGDGFKPANSLIQQKVLLEHCPDFLIGFFQSRTRLVASGTE